MTHDGQSQTQAPVFTRARVIALAKPVINKREKGGVYALARVRHSQFDVRAFALETHADASSSRRELDCIRQQIPDHLLQAGGVAGNESASGIEFGCDLDGLHRGDRPNGIERSLDNCCEIDGPDFQMKLAGDDPRSVKNILNESGLRFGGALDCLKCMRRSFFVKLSCAEYLHPSRYRMKRRSQLVRDGSKELVLRAIRCFGFGSRGFLAAEQIHEFVLAVNALGYVLDYGDGSDDTLAVDQGSDASALLHMFERRAARVGHRDQETMQPL